VILTDGVHLMDSEGDVRALHEFARGLGLERRWFQDHPRHPHYDLTTGRMRRKAVARGAKVVPSRGLVETGRRAGLTCPVCNAAWLYGPAEIIVGLATDRPEDSDSGTQTFAYYDCPRCHHLLLVVDGELVAKAGAW
jgi:hypothetical protein